MQEPFEREGPRPRGSVAVQAHEVVLNPNACRGSPPGPCGVAGIAFREVHDTGPSRWAGHHGERR